jgi:hypothetical protein
VVGAILPLDGSLGDRIGRSGLPNVEAGVNHFPIGDVVNGHMRDSWLDMHCVICRLWFPFLRLACP